MNLTEKPELVNWPETHYVFVEKTGPFMTTAPQAWGDAHALLGAISRHNRITGYMSLYKMKPDVYRAGFAVAAPPVELPDGVPASVPLDLYPVFVRGGVYLAAQQGSEAAAEFAKIIDHRSLVLASPIGALAYLGLARARVLQGDTASARTAYEHFLTLWKDADSDIPVLKKAKYEYQKIK